MELIDSDKKRVIVGIGLTGTSCARYFFANKIPFEMVDTRKKPAGIEAFRLKFPSVEVYCAEDAKLVIENADVLYVNPGLNLEHPLLMPAIAKGVEVSGDVDLFVEQAQAPIIAITGTNGKSTVTTLVGEMIKAAGLAVEVGGNIGRPVLDLLMEPVPDYYVLELSSFQLERAEAINAEVATVLNMSADHLDYHGSFPRYHQMKHRIFKGCKKAVINKQDPLSKPLVGEDVKLSYFNTESQDFNTFSLMNQEGELKIAYEFEELLATSELYIAGKHNIENALAALAIGKAIDLPFGPMIQALRSFKGLPHRSEWVDNINSVNYYNDSKGTNVGATKASIAGLAQLQGKGKIILIAGGTAKGATFGQLAETVNQYCRAIVVFGESANQLDLDLKAVADITRCNDMYEAVEKAAAIAMPGDIVLLSPACASFDMFRNFEQRGETFAAAVKRLRG